MLPWSFLIHEAHLFFSEADFVYQTQCLPHIRDSALFSQTTRKEGILLAILRHSRDHGLLRLVSTKNAGFTKVRFESPDLSGLSSETSGRFRSKLIV